MSGGVLFVVVVLVVVVVVFLRGELLFGLRGRHELLFGLRGRHEGGQLEPCTQGAREGNTRAERQGVQLKGP